MICPKCQQDVQMLLFTSTGTMCQVCKHGRFSAAESEAALAAIGGKPVEGREARVDDGAKDDGGARRAAPTEGEAENGPAWHEVATGFVLVMFFAIGASIAFRWGKVWQWLTFRTDCCFCATPHRMSGNPFVRKNISHGLCKVAMEQRLEEERARKCGRSKYAIKRYNAMQAMASRTHVSRSSLP